LTADLATSGTVADKFVNVVCSVTLATPIQYVAWWMLTFPVDTVYIGNVQIYYRENSECFHMNTFLKEIVLPYPLKHYTYFCNASSKNLSNKSTNLFSLYNLIDVLDCIRKTNLLIFNFEFEMFGLIIGV
jgi:hypothetical protein